MMKLKALTASGLLALSGLAAADDVVIENNPVEVCATVNAWLVCEWANGANKFNFGELNTNKGVVDDADKESRLTMNVAGTPNLTFYMKADAGQNYNGATRRMFKPASGVIGDDYLTYELVQPGTTPPQATDPLWGDDGVTHPGARFTFQTTPNGGDQLHFLAVVTDNPNLHLPGDYTDVVNIEAGY